MSAPFDLQRQHAQIAGDVVADSLPRQAAPQQRSHPRSAWNSLRGAKLHRACQQSAARLFCADVN
ncbi:hypothetical protein DU475_04910 [Rhodopseudomonas sp. WA056]|nr:hypothetical protein [Rhodopseudomonas sp. WA056]